MVGSARSEGPAAIEAPGARTTERTPPMAEQHPTPVLAGIYERISYDPKGDLLGTGRQEPPSRELCGRKGWTVRSEEHTSELQSRENLVCRLLHEKKKQQI